jgi:AraC-like DNA-binding protein
MLLVEGFYGKSGYGTTVGSMTGLGVQAAFVSDDTVVCDPLSHGQVVAAHFHDFGQLVYAASGALVTWMAPATRVTWVPPYIVHSRRTYGDTDVRVLCVSPSLSAQLPLQPSVFTVTPLLREAYLALVADRKEGEGWRETLLLDVIRQELTSAPEEALRLPEPNDDRLRAVTDILHADPANAETLAGLGHSAGVSDRTLSRLFSSDLGMSFHQWRTLLRVQRALIDLSEGRSVTETSSRLGWANPTSFIAAFTSLVGQTPGRYQQANAYASMLKTR